jgi:hypothetical protein
LLKSNKTFQVFALILLASALLLAATNPGIQSVKAQGQDTVVIYASVGGTTNPTEGTYNYTDGTAVTITANPGIGFEFVNWAVASAAGANTFVDNPLVITVSESAYAVQAMFQPINYISPATSSTSNNAIVVVLAAVGGTTTPAPGTYALANAANLNLTATPDSGWVFHNWIIGGSPLTHGAYSFTDTPTDNPYNVNHGYGNTYTYQPVFSPISTTTSPTPTVSEFSTEATIIIAVVLVTVLIAFGTYAYSKRK